MLRRAGTDDARRAGRGRRPRRRRRRPRGDPRRPRRSSWRRKEFDLLLYLAARAGRGRHQARAARRGLAAALRRRATRPSTCTCRGCAASSARRPPSRATCTASAASACKLVDPARLSCDAPAPRARRGRRHRDGGDRLRGAARRAAARRRGRPRGDTAEVQGPARSPPCWPPASARPLTHVWRNATPAAPPGIVFLPDGQVVGHASPLDRAVDLAHAAGQAFTAAGPAAAVRRSCRAGRAAPRSVRGCSSPTPSSSRGCSAWLVLAGLGVGARGAGRDGRPTASRAR